MKVVVVLAGIAMAATAAAEPVIISIGADAVDSVMDVARAKHAQAAVRMSNAKVAVVEIDAPEPLPLSRGLAERHRRDGFLVHASLAEAVGAMSPPTPPAMRYVLDRADLVKVALADIDEGRLRETSDQLTSYWRAPRRPDEIDLRFFGARWVHLRDRPRVTLSHLGPHVWPDAMVLTIVGSTRPDEVVMVSAQLDADGVEAAALDVIAEVLRARDFRPARTVQLVAYRGYEPGLTSSMALVREYQGQAARIVGVLQLIPEADGDADRPIWLVDDFANAAQNRFVASLIETYTTASWGYEQCGYGCSDHAVWHSVGVAASALHTSPSTDHRRLVHAGRGAPEPRRAERRRGVTLAQLGAAYAIELGKGTFGDPRAGLDYRTCGARQLPDLSRLSVTAWQVLGLLATALALLGMTRRVGR